MRDDVAQLEPAQAMAALARAARAGDAAAQFTLAVRLLPSRNGADTQAQGVHLLNAATAQYFPEALHLRAVMAAAGFFGEPEWSAAFSFLRIAAAKGHQRALAQLEILGEDFDIEAWLNPSPARMQFEGPRVGVVENFLPPEMCDWMIRSAAPRLAQAPVRQRDGAMVISDHRTNSRALIALPQSDLIFRLAQARLASVLGVPASHHEFPNVLHYKVGETFKLHRDYLEPTSPELAQRMALVGQRVATFLVYLNDGYQGGETDFPQLNWRYRGGVGDALFFWNVDSEGRVEPKLLHAGLPPSAGEKWLFSQWVRAKPMPLI